VFRLAVVGSRSFSDYALLSRVLSAVHTPITHIVSGGARGADSLAARYAEEHGIELLVFLPDWSTGKGAGFARNRLIVENADALIAFWDGVSRGTAHSIGLAKERGIPVYVRRLS
jgi:predicted Rossmann-fold nucleotide-binding protein